MVNLHCGCTVDEPTDTDIHWCPCDASWYIRDGERIAYGVGANGWSDYQASKFVNKVSNDMWREWLK